MVYDLKFRSNSLIQEANKCKKLLLLQRYPPQNTFLKGNGILRDNQNGQVSHRQFGESNSSVISPYMTDTPSDKMLLHIEYNELVTEYVNWVLTIQNLLKAVQECITASPTNIQLRSFLIKSKYNKKEIVKYKKHSEENKQMSFKKTCLTTCMHFLLSDTFPGGKICFSVKTTLAKSILVHVK